MWGPLIREDNLILSISGIGGLLSISIGSKQLIHVQSINSGITVSCEEYYGTPTQQTLYEAYTNLVKQKPITEKYNSCKNEIILVTRFDSFYILDYKVDLKKENICIIKTNIKEKLIDIFIPISNSKNEVNRFSRYLIEGSEDDFWRMVSIASEKENDVIFKEGDSTVITFARES